MAEPETQPHNNDKKPAKIGPYTLPGFAVLAPMAGISDYPFRKVCLNHGAALVTSEMTASNPRVRNSLKSQLRLPQALDKEPRIVQIVGSEPQMLAEAAQYQVEAGAQIIDINMGCPAKKVCKKLAGSALLADEKLVETILTTVVKSVEVPVTLKIRTGTHPEQKNAKHIAKIAEQSGIQSLAIHGRTRACKFQGHAEYDTIAEVVQQSQIPVFANGDITNAEQAVQILNNTDAAGIMVGRGAQGKPWIFSEINQLLGGSESICALFPDKSLNLIGSQLLERLIIDHLRDIHDFYDHAATSQTEISPRKINKRQDLDNSFVNLSVKVARKHICWYFEQLKYFGAFRDQDCFDGGNMTLDTAHDSGQNVMIKVKSNDESKKELNAFISTRKKFNQIRQQSEQLEFIQQLFADLRLSGVFSA